MNLDLDVRVCSTGQHEELLRPMLEFFGIVPDFSLDVMKIRKGIARGGECRHHRYDARARGLAPVI